jgi:hypothetical protein
MYTLTSLQMFDPVALHTRAKDVMINPRVARAALSIVGSRSESKSMRSGPVKANVD